MFTVLCNNIFILLITFESFLSTVLTMSLTTWKTARIWQSILFVCMCVHLCVRMCVYVLVYVKEAHKRRSWWVEIAFTWVAKQRENGTFLNRGAYLFIISREYFFSSFGLPELFSLYNVDLSFHSYLSCDWRAFHI